MRVLMGDGAEMCLDRATDEYMEGYGDPDWMEEQERQADARRRKLTEEGFYTHGTLLELPF
jgi:hypothetical protein